MAVNTKVNVNVVRTCFTKEKGGAVLDWRRNLDVDVDVRSRRL